MAQHSFCWSVCASFVGTPVLRSSTTLATTVVVAKFGDFPGVRVCVCAGTEQDDAQCVYYLEQASEQVSADNSLDRAGVGRYIYYILPYFYIIAALALCVRVCPLFCVSEMPNNGRTSLLCLNRDASFRCASSFPLPTRSTSPHPANLSLSLLDLLSQGLAKAMFNLGLMYEKRRGVSPEAPEADLLEATRECYEAAAEAGVTKAMVRIQEHACMYARLSCCAALRPCRPCPLNTAHTDVPPRVSPPCFSASRCTPVVPAPRAFSYIYMCLFGISAFIKPISPTNSPSPSPL